MPIIIILPIIAIYFFVLAIKTTGFTRGLAVISVVTLSLLWAWYFMGFAMLELPD
jgi:hypothetical protein